MFKLYKCAVCGRAVKWSEMYEDTYQIKEEYEEVEVITEERTRFICNICLEKILGDFEHA